MDLAIDQTRDRDRGLLGDSGLPGLGLSPVTHVAREHLRLEGRRAGKVVVESGRLQAVCGRWWPHAGNMLQVWWDMRFRAVKRDRCELLYHQPLGSPGFLTLSYIRSGPQTSLSTFYASTLVLDEIARLKGAHAIVCHVTNSRISDRLFARWGWQQHCLNWSGRHFIKRFYGEYPTIPDNWRKRLTLDL